MGPAADGTCRDVGECGSCQFDERAANFLTRPLKSVIARSPAQEQPNHLRTMFGAFRFTNPLSGGLLWYVLYIAILGGGHKDGSIAKEGASAPEAHDGPGVHLLHPTHLTTVNFDDGGGGVTT